MTTRNPVAPSGGHSTKPLLDPYWALIFVIAALAGVVIGVLAFLAGQPWASAVIAGLIAAGATGKGATSLIGPTL